MDKTSRKQAEETFRGLEQRPADILESISDGFFSLDDNLTVTYFNKAAERLLGRRGEDVIGRNLFEAFPEAKGSIFEEKYTLAVREKCAVSFETRFDVKPYENWYEVRVFPYRTGISVYFQVTTERKRAEEALRESEEKFKHVFENLPIGISLTLPAGEVQPNKAFYQMLGYSREPPALKWQDITHPDDIEQSRRIVDRILSGENDSDRFVKRYIHRDGSVVWAEISTTARRDAEGKTQYLITAINDITTRVRMEKALRESEHRYRELFENSRDGFVVVDAGGRFMDANRAYCRMLGYTLNELRNKLDFYEITPKRWREWEQTEIWENRLCREGYSGIYEKEYTRKDGTVFPVELQSYAVFGDDGNPLYLWGICRDITERKQTEKALRENENKFRSITENATDLIFIKDRNRRYTFVNRAMINLLGLPEEAILGKTPEEIFGPEQGQIIKEVDDRVFAGKTVSETKSLDIGGQQLFFHTIQTPLSIDDGGVQTIMGIVRDVTENKHAEQTLRESEEKYRLIFNNSPLGIMHFDEYGVVTDCNENFAEIIGAPKERLVGFNMLESMPDVPARWAVEEAIATGTGHFEGDYHTVTGDKQIVIRANHRGIIGKNGGLLGAVGIFEDITERKRVEAELEKYREHLEELVKIRTAELEIAKQKAEAANRAKSLFLANMSHELRTPLNAILGFSNLMGRDPEFPEKYEENLGIINRSGEHLLYLINDVLEISRIEAGKDSLKPIVFDLGRTLGTIEGMIRIRAEKKGLALRFEIAPGIPAFVRTDERKLRQILINLLGNAVKFTNEGSVDLSVGIGPNRFSKNCGATDHCLVFTVRDTGPGIEPEELGTIFDMFAQTGSGRLKQEGTGLGLYISKRFAMLMGGDIAVESKPGGGSTFSFHIIAERALETELPSCEIVRRVVGLEPDQPAFKILAVDDNSGNRTLMRRLLESAGFSVKEAANGKLAVRMFQKWSPHLILMDIRMPVMDGLQATKQIRDMEARRCPKTRTPILALTAHAFDEEREAFLAMGCDDFIRKPFKDGDIFEAIRGHLNVKFMYTEHETGVAPEPAEHAPEKALAAALSEDMLANLEDAALRSDMVRINRLIADIRPHDAECAEKLEKMASRFDYDRVLEFVRMNNE